MNFIVLVRATNMNEHSSRSHAIFIITVESSEVRIKISPFENYNHDY